MSNSQTNTNLNQQEDQQIIDLTPEEIIQKSQELEEALDKELDLFQPYEFFDQSDTAWQMLFKLIKRLYYDEQIDKETIAYLINLYGELATDDEREKFCFALMRDADKRKYEAQIGINDLKYKNILERLDSIVQLIPDEFREPFLLSLYDGEIPEEVLKKLQVEGLEDLTEEQVKEYANSAVYRYKNEGGLNLGIGERTGFANNTRPMSRDQLANLLDSTQKIQEDINNIPEYGLNPLLDNQDNKLDQVRKDGFRGGFSAVSDLINKKQSQTQRLEPQKIQTAQQTSEVAVNTNSESGINLATASRLKTPTNNNSTLTQAATNFNPNTPNGSLNIASTKKPLPLQKPTTQDLMNQRKQNVANSQAGLITRQPITAQSNFVNPPIANNNQSSQNPNSNPQLFRQYPNQSQFAQPQNLPKPQNPVYPNSTNQGSRLIPRKPVQANGQQALSRNSAPIVNTQSKPLSTKPQPMAVSRPTRSALSPSSVANLSSLKGRLPDSNR